MPRTPRSQRRTAQRRTPPPPRRTAAFGAPPPAPASRTERLIARDAPYLGAELRRIAVVSGACFGLLGLLVVVDRLT